MQSSMVAWRELIRLPGMGCRMGAGRADRVCGMSRPASALPKRSVRVCSPRVVAALPLAPASSDCDGARESCAAAHAMFPSTTHRANARLSWLPSRPRGRGSHRASARGLRHGSVDCGPSCGGAPEGAHARARVWAAASSFVCATRVRVTQRSSRRTNQGRFSLVRRGGC